MKVEIVPATRDDIITAMLELYGEVRDIPLRVMAFAGRYGNRVLGVGGVAFYPNGARVAFCDVGDEGRKHKIALHKAALMTIEAAKAMKVRTLLVTTDGMHDKTPAWLLRLGFEPKFFEGRAVYVREL